MNDTERSMSYNKTNIKVMQSLKHLACLSVFITTRKFKIWINVQIINLKYSTLII